MNPFSKSETTALGTVFRDLLINALFVVLVVVFVLLIQPKKPDEASSEAARTHGNLRIEIYWPDEMDVDIDTWGQAPGLPPIGYSNMNGPVMNLVRDDLGHYADISGRNQEVMFSRGLPQGEWTFNIHWFGNAGGVEQVPVTVLLTLRRDDSAGSKERPEQVVATELMLQSVGEEITVVRFTLDADGKIVPGSMHSGSKYLRSDEGG